MYIYFFIFFFQYVMNLMLSKSKQKEKGKYIWMNINQKHLEMLKTFWPLTINKSNHF